MRVLPVAKQKSRRATGRARFEKKNVKKQKRLGLLRDAPMLAARVQLPSIVEKYVKKKHVFSQNTVRRCLGTPVDRGFYIQTGGKTLMPHSMSLQGFLNEF